MLVKWVTGASQLEVISCLFCVHAWPESSSAVLLLSEEAAVEEL